MAMPSPCYDSVPRCTNWGRLHSRAEEASDRHEGTLRLHSRGSALQPRSIAFFVPVDECIPKMVEVTERNGAKKRDNEYLPIEILVWKNSERAFGGDFLRQKRISCLASAHVKVLSST